jgi:hypothetical protein
MNEGLHSDTYAEFNDFSGYGEANMQFDPEHSVSHDDPLSFEQSIIEQTLAAPQRPKEDKPGGVMLEEGWERETIEFGLVALESLAALLSPVELPRSEMTTDPQIQKSVRERERAQIIAKLDFNEHQQTY